MMPASTRCERNANDPAVDIAAALGDALDVDPLDLEPLEESVSVDAIRSLLDSDPEADVTVKFRHEGCVVTVDARGTVRVRS